MANQKSNQKLEEVKFLISPSSAPFNLAYHIGDVVKVDAQLAAEMVDAGVCELTSKSEDKK